MAYREGNFSELCGDCRAPAEACCRRCGTPLCATHDTGAEYRCFGCELAYLSLETRTVQAVVVTLVIVGALVGVVGALAAHAARNVVQVVSYKGIWSGLPRPVIGFLTLGYILSLTVHHLPVLLWGGLALIPLICWAALTRLPFANHHLPRKHYGFVRFLIALTFIALIGAIAFYPRVLFDLLFIAIGAYTVGSATILTADERAEYRAAVVTAQEAAA